MTVFLLIAGMRERGYGRPERGYIFKNQYGDNMEKKIVIELDPAKAPLTVKNFFDYVNAGFYNGTIFHRVISNFMIQGGGMNPDMSEKKNNNPVKNEADNGLKNKRGTIAMARTRVVDSATSQFFINLKDNGFLDHTAKNIDAYGYCVFGKVTEGMDVVDEIAQVKTGRSGFHSDVPQTPVLIVSASALSDTKVELIVSIS